MSKSSIKFAFFGSSRFSVIVLEEMEKLGFIPSCIVTTPDKPQGRKMILTPNVVKTWGIQKNIKVFDPAKNDAQFLETLKKENLEIFIVASYGKILSKSLIEIPPHKTLNIHPSLLPKYRGASPLPSVILADDKNTGVTIMRMDEEMDHGPIIGRKEIRINDWPIYEDFEERMAREGADLLVSILPDWIAGKIQEKPQDHEAATFTKKIAKEDGLLDLSADPYLNFRKIQAYHAWPGSYFFIEHNTKRLRVKITKASFQENILTIEKVIPEGSKEMSYKDFLSGYEQTKN